MSAPFTLGIKRLIAAGAEYAKYGLYDSDGLICGQAGVLATSADSGFGRWYAIKKLDLGIPEYARITQTGDDIAQGSMLFPSADPVTLAIQTGVLDQDVEVGLDTSKLETIDNYYMQSIAPQISDLPLAMLLVGVKMKSKTSNQSGYLNYLFTECQIAQGGPDAIAERTFENYDYTGFANPVDKNPWQVALSLATHGTLFNVGVKWTSKNPVNIHNFKAPASLNPSFTVDDTPAAESGKAMKIWKNVAGVVTPLVYTTDFAVVASTKTVTLVGTPVLDTHYFVLYEHL